MALQMPNLNSNDARVADLVFEFVQFLLDDDANLTPAGNLTGAARQKLRARLDELIAAEEVGGAALAEQSVVAADSSAPASASQPGGTP